ncbi:hypothetical protein BRYFOR_07007 [Marvinbryantia formatexigens DSM 14469]|uniref:Lipoprotein n=2 Tax=Marvinbryantia TaxID=248744 RepID=C6LEF8_9FIRM|nr:hypothetical protein BRYFOR_07007 [Marvinbryantia formatexigens DSM 14469]
MATKKQEDKDMRKIKGFAAVLCAAAVMTGCAGTPEQAIVREKSGQSLDNYKEAESQMSVSPQEAGTANAADGQESAADIENAAGGQEDAADKTGASAGGGSGSAVSLSARLQAPETYEAQVQTKDGTFTLNCHAEVAIPDAGGASVYRVGQMEFTQEWIDRVTEAFFGDSPVYNGYTYNGVTKAEALEKLNQLKAWQAEGNTDPYGYIAEAKAAGMENPEESYDLQQDIDAWEQTYAEAPETRDYTEVKPGLDGGFAVQENGDDLSVDNFIGMVEMDGNLYRYQLKRYPSMPMIIDITNYGSGSPDENWRSWYAADFDGAQETALLTGEPSQYDSAGITKEKLTEMAGITPEEAQEMADGYMEKLGLADDFSAKNVALSVCSENSRDNAGAQTIGTDAGYLVSYTRDIDGFPVTDEEKMGGGAESMDSTQETWSYEKVEFTVNKDGIQYVEIHNLYEIGEQQVTNVEMLPFAEIADIFESMLQIQNADMTYSKGKTFDIDRVTLGYMRVYDPGADSASGLLVPVWDFFGKGTDYAVYQEEEYVNVQDDPRSSFMTINAADGTVIDRTLGY